MKKFSLLALAAAGLLFGACSEKDAVVSDERETTQYDQAFVGIAIELPSNLTPTTRANDDLNNGETAEFTVANARLLLFKGGSEATATFVYGTTLEDATTGWEYDDKGAGDPHGATQDVSTTTKVTTSKMGVAKIQDLKLLNSDKLYGYVILNNNGVSDPSANTEFQDWADAEFAASTLGFEYDATNHTDKVKSTGLLMTNAPVVATAGGTYASEGPSTTAVDLTKNIKKTKDEAIANPAGCIFVERAAAKLTVSATGATTTLITPGTSEATLPFTVNGFQVINTEPYYYNTRHVEDTWLGWTSDYYTSGYSSGYASSKAYRFASVNKFAPTKPTTGNHAEVYRTFFAKDIKYDVDPTGRGDAKYNLVNPEAVVSGNWIAIDDGTTTPVPKAYMPENTFDVGHQTRQNTTCATIKVTFNGGANLWSVKNDDKLYLDATIDGAITEKVQHIYEVDTWIKKAAQELATKYTNDESTTVTVDGEVTASLNEKTTAGEKKAYTVVYSFTRSDSKEAKFSDLSQATQDEWTGKEASGGNPAVKGIKEKAEADFEVNLYAGGVSYYNVRIQHFGEYETPWDKITNATAQADTQSPFKIQPGDDVAKIYGYTSGKEEIASKRFLGRYGVVRDNWYKITIGTISKLGTPNPKTVSADDTPDDQIEEEFWISAHVHIVPWVLRTQTVNF